MPTFHPAYLMRNPKDKWLTWDDALRVLERIGKETGVKSNKTDTMKYRVRGQKFLLPEGILCPVRRRVCPVRLKIFSVMISFLLFFFRHQSFCSGYTLFCPDR